MIPLKAAQTYFIIDLSECALFVKYCVHMLVTVNFTIVKKKYFLCNNRWGPKLCYKRLMCDHYVGKLILHQIINGYPFILFFFFSFLYHGWPMSIWGLKQ